MILDIFCDDCKIEKAAIHYLLGAKRCKDCSNAFDAANRLRSQEEERIRREYHICGESSDDVCTECCEHWEHDHGYCLDCGESVLDLLIMQAEAYSDWLQDR